MTNIDPNDPPPTPCLDGDLPAPLAPNPSAGRALPVPSPDDPYARQSPPARHVYSPTGDLPGLATRIDEAQRQARQRRIEQGLPAEADDGAYVRARPRKHAAKRSKKHGQFLGTVCDSWAEALPEAHGRRGGETRPR